MQGRKSIQCELNRWLSCSPAGDHMEFIVTGHPVSIDHSTVIFVVFRFQNARDNDQGDDHCYNKEKAAHAFYLSM